MNAIRILRENNNCKNSVKSEKDEIYNTKLTENTLRNYSVELTQKYKSPSCLRTCKRAQSALKAH